MKKHQNYQEANLCKCFINLVNTVGYDKLNVKILTKEAQMNRTAFYMFFSGKAELAEYICYNYLEHHNEILAKVIVLRDKGKTRDLLYEAFENIRKNVQTIKALWSINEPDFAPYLIMQQGMSDTIVKVIKQSEDVYENYIRLFADTFAASAMATIKLFIEDDCNNIKFYVEHIIIACYDGMNQVLINREMVSDVPKVRWQN